MRVDWNGCPMPDPQPLSLGRSMNVRIRIQTVLGEWTESAAAEFTEESRQALHDAIADVMSDKAGHLSVEDADGTVTWVPVAAIARVVSETVDRL
jgi:hypothetical protein